jgi:hypothetical protein
LEDFKFSVMQHHFGTFLVCLEIGAVELSSILYFFVEKSSFGKVCVAFACIVFLSKVADIFSLAALSAAVRFIASGASGYLGASWGSVV